MKRKIYEGSPLDEKRDRKQAKKHGMTEKEWERSSMDKKQDAMYQREMNKKAKKAKKAKVKKAKKK